MPSVCILNKRISLFDVIKKKSRFVSDTIVKSADSSQILTGSILVNSLRVTTGIYLGS